MGERRDCNPEQAPTLHKLVVASRAMADEPDSVRALGILVEALRNDLRIDRAGIFSVDRFKDTVERVVGIDDRGRPEYSGETYPLHAAAGPSPMFDVVERRIPYYFSDDAPRDYPERKFGPGVRHHAVIPIVAGDELLGVLAVDNALTGRPIPERALDPLFLAGALAARPLFATHQERERARVDSMRRNILRQVFSAVTSGKVQLCDDGEVDHEWPALDHPLSIERPEDVREVREAVRTAGVTAGMTSDRAWYFGLCASEAATNALRHGKGGVASVARNDDRLRFRVEDRGSGISLEDLPGATLQAGWSSRASMGQGFTLIHGLADRVFLTTGPGGTTIIVEMGIEPEPELGSQWDALMLEMDED